MRSSLVEPWRVHLTTAGTSQIHFVETALCEPTVILRAADALGMEIFHLNGDQIDGTADFMNRLAHAARFPDYFGHNWDAVSDLLRDLSWAPANGYLLLITKADGLLGMGSGDLGRFIRVLETVIHDWRDERGEYAERPASISFHAVLCGAGALREELVRVASGPPCEHLS